MIEMKTSMSNNLDTPEFETNEIHLCIQSNLSCDTIATSNGSMMNVWCILTWQLYYTTGQCVSMMTLTSRSLEIESSFNNKFNEYWRMSMYGELHLTYSCLHRNHRDIHHIYFRNYWNIYQTNYCRHYTISVPLLMLINISGFTPAKRSRKC